jgi:hypothetical protein
MRVTFGSEGGISGWAAKPLESVVKAPWEGPLVMNAARFVALNLRMVS